MLTEAQKRAKAKYAKKLERVVVEFYPTEADLLDHVKAQPTGKATYIKNLIKADMEK